MSTIKQDAIDIITKMPDSAAIDDIMYQLYVLGKVKKGQEEIQKGYYTKVEDLRKEFKSW